MNRGSEKCKIEPPILTPTNRGMPQTGWFVGHFSDIKMRSILWRFTKMAVGVYIIGGPPTENQQQDVSLRNALKKGMCIVNN